MWDDIESACNYVTINHINHNYMVCFETKPCEKVNCKYYHDGCMVTGLRSTMEEHEERFFDESSDGAE